MTEYLTAEEVASQFKVSVDTVYRLAQSGRLPCVKLGRVVRFRPQDLEAFGERGGSHRGNLQASR